MSTRDGCDVSKISRMRKDPLSILLFICVEPIRSFDYRQDLFLVVVRGNNSSWLVVFLLFVDSYFTVPIKFVLFNEVFFIH